MSKRNFLAIFLMSFINLLCAFGAGQANAQTDYPVKPVRVMIPFPAGSSTDVMGRLMVGLLSKDLGQPFVVVNDSGASGTIGTAKVAKSTPDGYSLLIGSPSTIVMNPHFQKDVPYDVMKEFQPVSLIWSVPAMVLVSKDAPFSSSLRALIAEAKRNPGKLNYGSGGAFSYNHIAGELFASIAGIRMTHIPYKGVAPAMIDLMANQLDVIVGTLAGYLSAKDRLVGLAIAAPKRSDLAPHVPTTAEVGLPTFIFGSWGGLFAPVATPPRIVEKLSATIAKTLSPKEVRERFVAMGVDPAFSSPEEYRRQVEAEFAQIQQLIEAAGLKVKM